MFRVVRRAYSIVIWNQWKYISLQRVINISITIYSVYCALYSLNFILLYIPGIIITQYNTKLHDTIYIYTSCDYIPCSLSKVALSYKSSETMSAVLKRVFLFPTVQGTYCGPGVPTFQCHWVWEPGRYISNRLLKATKK